MKFTLNKKQIEVTDSWDKTTYGQYLRILKLDRNVIELISILTGIDIETLKKAEIQGLDKILYASRFTNTPPEIPTKLTHIGRYKLPLTKDGVFDIQFESLAQFEDMREIIGKLPNDDNQTPIERVYNLTKCYGELVAIYLQKLRDGKYDYSKAELMADEVSKIPALQVIAGGTFFLTKLLVLFSGTNPNSRKQRAVKRTGIRSRKRLVRKR